MPLTASQPLQIWCLLDGKAGHQNQVWGCAESLQRLVPAELHNVSLKGWNRGFWPLLKSDSATLPETAPDLIIGAGHASHVPMWMWQRRFGGQSIVLMKPSMPLSCFDFCLIPDAHQLSTIPANVILTRGVLNRIQPGTQKDSSQGLMLIGGPSTHYRWSDEQVQQQVQDILLDDSTVRWTIATSRRTPDSFCQRVLEGASVVNLVRPDDVSVNWLPQQLATVETVWVTEDSVSMTYEALTSGSRVGLLELEPHGSDRVIRGINLLVDDGYVTRWNAWRETKQLCRRPERFCEAERCAAELVRRLAPQQIRLQKAG